MQSLKVEAGLCRGRTWPLGFPLGAAGWDCSIQEGLTGPQVAQKASLGVSGEGPE